MAVNLKDVATLAGVAPITVSRALGNSPLVTERTRRKVMEAGVRCGYRPHAGARALRSNRFNTVGLLLSSEHTYLPSGLVAGVVDALETRRLGLHVMRLTDQQLTSPDFAPRVLAERMVDGLLINYTINLPPQMVEQIREHHLPSVWINIKEPTDCVYADMYGGARQATRHLIELGHRRIGYLDFVNDVSQPDRGHYSVRDSWDGCRDAVAASGTTARLTALSKEFVLRRDRPALARALLEGNDRPTAIIACSSNHALTCLHAALSLGLRVPEDLSLITYHDAPIYDDSGLEFATIAIPVAEMGRLAVTLLTDKINQAGISLPSVSLVMPFTPGQTCAPPVP